ncbi:MAG: adenylyl-sulfate kinase [Desulfuromonas sp.]|uniref:adenylyl-sulfate kinase n=1 Tax=Desulfuromonas sp. TaxID=892 RepID=UPI000CA7E821|nr:adenylyl-sulfate kinase [Desulfuromonas sp.]PLX84436.1 MAG: adenylyl-sulfate kinase [Desulfuromonas sp.]
MQYETKGRSILKAISWRTWATITTAVIVLIFTGKLTLAITVGLLEVVAKMGLYFIHERMWHRIGYGKKEIPSFILWFTGLPASGKKELADRVYRQLLKDKLKAERLDSLDVRPLFPETGFAREDVNEHVKRAGHLCAMLEKNGVIVVASFVSPYRESREFVRGVAKNYVEVYLKTTPEACERRDTKGHYQKAREGIYRDFHGVDVDYEEPRSPEVVIEVDEIGMDEAAQKIVSFLKKNVINQGK